MNISNIIVGDMANGPGFRVSVFVSRCRNACPGCFNQSAWDFNAGIKMTPEIEKTIIDSLCHDEIAGITVLGGEPLEPENQQDILHLLSQIKNRYYPDKTVWLYTGRTLRQNNEGNWSVSSNFADERTDPANTPILGDILGLCDVVVDGPFLLSLKDPKAFRGSSNQRIIDMKKTERTNQIVLWQHKEPSVHVL